MNDTYMVSEKTKCRECAVLNTKVKKSND